MSTSAEPRPDFVVRPHRYGDPEVVRLVADVQAEYVARYGGPDQTPLDPRQFDPPGGLFLLGELDGRAVACGGWRTLRADAAEIKRMYVAAPARRRGLAALVLAELERTAVERGFERMVLETGSKQPEAIAMYEKFGYRPVERFGYYRCAPEAVHLGKALRG